VSEVPASSLLRDAEDTPIESDAVPELRDHPGRIAEREEGVSEPTERPSTASIDRRVERLEISHAEMQRTVDRLEVGMANLKEVMGLRFSGIEAAHRATDIQITSLAEKVDITNKFIQSAIAESNKMASEVDATPAGRLVSAEIKELQTSRESTDKRLSKIEAKIYVAAGALGILMTIVNFLAPVVLRTLHLVD
jgi:hypothetical protein